MIVLPNAALIDRARSCCTLQQIGGRSTLEFFEFKIRPVERTIALQIRYKGKNTAMIRGLLTVNAGRPTR
jgi:hypothetical protein